MNMYQQRHIIMTNSKGFGLIELMIAMAIGLVLMLGVLELYVSNKQAYKTTEALGRLQENARYAMYQVQKELRIAGYTDCAPNIIDHLNSAGSGYDATLFDLDHAVGGWESNSASGTGPGDNYTLSSNSFTAGSDAASNWADQDGSVLPTSIQGLAIAGSDILAVKSLSEPRNISVQSTNNINNVPINVNGPSGVAQYSILLVTQDCYNADMFQKRNIATDTNISRGNGTSTTPGPGNEDQSNLFTGGRAWSLAYGSGARFYNFQSNVYFVGNDDGTPSLFKMSFNTGSAGTVEKIVDGVESMQILYGEDTDVIADGVANIYRTIDTVVDPAKISSVRISLLLRTMEAVAAEVDSKTDYKLAGHSSTTATEINPVNDRFLRFVFTSTVKLRNKGSL